MPLEGLHPGNIKDTENKMIIAARAHIALFDLENIWVIQVFFILSIVYVRHIY
jgi:hypothetical protein